MHRVVPALAAFALAFSVARASAQYASCATRDGSDPAAAYREGVAARRAWSAPGTTDARRHALATDALAAFDRQCAAGDDSALVERATALVTLGRWLEACQSYDAYLAQHDVEARFSQSLPDALVHVVAAEQAELFVQPVEESGEAPMALDFGPLPRSHELRLLAGTYRLEARREGRPLATAVVTATSGQTVNAVLDVEVEATRPDATSDHPERLAEPPTATTPTPVVGHHLFTSDPPDPADDGWMFPAAIGTAIAAGAFLVTGVALHLVAENRAQTYRAEPCNGSPTPLSSSCGSVLGEYNATFPAAIAFDVLAGAAAIASTVLFVLEMSRPHSVRTSGTADACSVGLTGVGCTLRF